VLTAPRTRHQRCRRQHAGEQLRYTARPWHARRDWSILPRLLANQYLLSKSVRHGRGRIYGLESFLRCTETKLMSTIMSTSSDDIYSAKEQNADICVAYKTNVAARSVLTAVNDCDEKRSRPGLRTRSCSPDPLARFGEGQGGQGREGENERKDREERKVHIS